MKNNFQKKDRKAFTIVELVIVIAVIAILAAVLIPTFSNIIKKSQISADVQLCRNLNTVLANADAQGRIPHSMYDVLYLENEAGFILSNLNPTADNFYFGWDEKQNKILYIESDLETVRYPEDYKLDPTTVWITVGTAEEMLTVSNKNFNIYCEKDIDAQGIVLKNAVSIDTGAFTLSNLSIDASVTSSTPVESWIIGQYTGSTNINVSGSVTYNQRGSINSLSMSGNNAAINLNGTVSNYNGSSGVSSTVNSSALVSTITGGSSVVNNGVVLNNQTTGSTSGTGRNTLAGNSFSVSTKEQIEDIRQAVANGTRSYKDETIKLSNDINMNGIAFQPISSYFRKTAGDTSAMATQKGATVWFQGTFDGDNHTIYNFSNTGFSIDGLTAGTNSSSESFNNVEYNESIYGIFASVYNAEIKNLNVTCDINMEIDNGNHRVGDSIGGIVGFAFGDYLKMENCTVNGTIRGYDACGGLVGRAYVTDLYMNNCTNNATITAVRRAGGLVGFISTDISNIKIWDEDSGKLVVKAVSSCTPHFDNCISNGVVTCLGVGYDRDLGASKAFGYSATHNYYRAASTINYPDGAQHNISPSASTKGSGCKVYIGDADKNLVEKDYNTYNQ